MDGTQRRGACRVDDAVGSVQIEPVGDPAGYHVGQKSGEGFFLPRHIAVCDPSDHVLAGLRIDAGLRQSLSPNRVAQAGPQGDHQRKRSAHTEDHAGALAVEFPAVGPVAGIPERFSGNVHAEQLCGVGGLEVPW